MDCTIFVAENKFSGDTAVISQTLASLPITFCSHINNLFKSIAILIEPRH